jgi:hypothetical protein
MTDSANVEWNGAADGKNGTIAIDIYRKMVADAGDFVLKAIKALSSPDDIAKVVPKSYTKFEKLSEHQKNTLEKSWTTDILKDCIRKQIWDDYQKRPPPKQLSTAGND